MRQLVKANMPRLYLLGLIAMEGLSRFKDELSSLVIQEVQEEIVSMIGVRKKSSAAVFRRNFYCIIFFHFPTVKITPFFARRCIRGGLSFVNVMRSGNSFVLAIESFIYSCLVQWYCVATSVY